MQRAFSGCPSVNSDPILKGEVAEPYLQRLSHILDRLQLVSAEGLTLEPRHFFSGAALYVNGRICASLGPAGFAIKVPAGVRQSLLNEGKGKEFRFFAKGPIKREYVVLSEAAVQDDGTLQQLIAMSVAYADGASGSK
jgi:hypothetical protein